MQHKMADNGGSSNRRVRFNTTDDAEARARPLTRAETDEDVDLWDGPHGSSPSSRLLPPCKEIEENEREMVQRPAASDEWDHAAPVTKRVILELLLCILSFVGRGLCLNSLGPTLMDLRQLAKVQVEASAIIFVSQSAGLFLGSLLAKLIFQKLNHELTMGLALVTQALCTAVVPLTSLLVVMCFAFAGQGFCIGVVGIGVTMLCLKLGGQQRNGMYLQAVYLGVSVGSIIGPFLAQPFLSVEAIRHGSDKLVDILMVAAKPLNGSTSAPSASDVSRSAPEPEFNSPSSKGTLLSTPPSSLFPPILRVSNGSAVTSGSHITPGSAISYFFNETGNGSVSALLNETTSEVGYTSTNVIYDYIIIAIVLCLPSAGFFALYALRDHSQSEVRPVDARGESLSLRSCAPPLFLAIVLLFAQCLLFFGMQDSYSNLLATFVVLSDLRLKKARGVYATSIFWAAICVGRLNGIWIAKFVSPFKMLLVDTIVAVAAAIALVSFGHRNEYVLWTFSFILGLAFATVNAATVSWAARHIVGSSYLLSIIMVGRCSGLLIIPTAIAGVFKVAGATALMRALIIVCTAHFLCLIGGHFIVKRWGRGGRLSGKQPVGVKGETDS